MADIVDFKGQQLDPHLDERTVQVFDTLEDLGKKNARQEIRSLVVVGVDYNNNTFHTSVRQPDDELLVLGAIELMKDLVVRSIAGRRVSVDRISEP